MTNVAHNLFQSVAVTPARSLQCQCEKWRGLCRHCRSRLAYSRKVHGGKRFRIIARDRARCRGCDSSQWINVHHIDGNDRNSTDDNELVLCARHHAQIERSTKVFKCRGFSGEELLIRLWKRIHPGRPCQLALHFPIGSS